MRGFLAAVALTLAACGGGGGGVDTLEPVPIGVPTIVGGFVNWYDYTATPGNVFGIHNATGQAIVELVVVSATETVTLPAYVGAGETWLDLDGDVAPDFYAVYATGANGNEYARYFRYDGAGRDACYVSNANRDFGF